MAVTLRDLGQRAGVSHTTVARALKGDRNVSDTVRQRVAKAARELNYEKVNRFSHNKSIAVCVMNVNIPICSSILKGAEDFLHEQDYSVIVQSVGCEGRHPSEVIPMFRSRGIGGVILQSGLIFDDLRWLLDAIEAEFPIVMADCKVPYVNTPFVVSDNFGGSIKLVKELASQNCKRIAFIGVGPGLSRSAIDLRATGRVFSTAICPLMKSYALPAAAKKIFTKHPKFLAWANGDIKIDGIVTANDNVFETVVHNCMVEHQAVLDQCKFATFDFPTRGFSYPMPIVVALQNTYRMGADAAKIAVDLCEHKNGDGSVHQQVIDVEIIKNVHCHSTSTMLKANAVERMPALSNK